MFCLNYFPNQEFIPEDIEEIRIQYNPQDNTLKDFLEKVKDRPIVIDISTILTDIEIILFKELYKLYNIKFIINFYNTQLLNQVQEIGIPYFFINPVVSIDQLYGLLKYKPTDMYICEELGFHINKISKILHNNNIKVRVFPNICQSSFNQTPSLKTFFIRPEDINFYSQYVDIFELIQDADRQQIIYKIYKRGYWMGELKEIIPSFNPNVLNRNIFELFGQKRAKCGKKCFYKPDSCLICESIIDLANQIERKNKEISIKQNEQIQILKTSN